MTVAAGPTLAQRTFKFTLHVLNVSELTDDIATALYEAGCDDALAGMSNGVVFLDFDREADSFEEAVQSAIADVQSAGFEARLVPTPA
jgi:hypothetical protein